MKEKKYSIDIESGAWNPHAYYGSRNTFIDDAWYDAIQEAEKEGISFDELRPKKKAVVTKTPKEPEVNRMLLIC
jgi:hypothetical protein